MEISMIFTPQIKRKKKKNDKEEKADKIPLQADIKWECTSFIYIASWAFLIQLLVAPTDGQSKWEEKVEKAPCKTKIVKEIWAFFLKKKRAINFSRQNPK